MLRVAAFVLFSWSVALAAPEANLAEGVGLKGFDPVACFPEGGARAAEGSGALTAAHGGATWRFASDGNRKRFEKDPARYAPAYGGWCATAVAAGKLVDVDPKVFRVRGADLLVFASAKARDAWLADEDAMVKRANAEWTRRGGERVPAEAPPARAVGHWNLEEGLAIAGYDPVAYFPEGGAAPAKGDPGIAWTWGGATYRFATEANREQFKSHPARYEPAYGGWCAYAVGAKARKVPVDPLAYLVEEDRLLLFFRNKKLDTRDLWTPDVDELSPAAKENWREMSGE